MHVEAFVWDPMTPVVMSVNNYEAHTELTLKEAKKLSKALIRVIKKIEGK